ncbi:hypothetical protein pb186bvf_016095 [Paramecium bursaria]
MGCKLSNIDTDQFNIVPEQRRPIVIRDFKADLHQMIQQDEMRPVDQNDQTFLPALSSISNCLETSSPDRKSQLKTLKLIVNQIQPHTKCSAFGKKKTQRITMDDLEQAF